MLPEDGKPGRCVEGLRGLTLRLLRRVVGAESRASLEPPEDPIVLASHGKKFASIAP